MQIRSVFHLGTHSTLPFTGTGFCTQIDELLRRNIIITIREYDHSAVLGADAVGIHRHCRFRVSQVGRQVCGHRIDGLPVIIQSGPAGGIVSAGTDQRLSVFQLSHHISFVSGIGSTAKVNYIFGGDGLVHISECHGVSFRKSISGTIGIGDLRSRRCLCRLYCCFRGCCRGRLWNLCRRCRRLRCGNRFCGHLRCHYRLLDTCSLCRLCFRCCHQCVAVSRSPAMAA